MTATATSRPRRRHVPRWVPNQHGAWAMLVLPWLLGTILRLRSGEPASHLLPLLACWLTGYVAFYAASSWLKAPAGRRAPWLRPLVTAGALAGAFGLVTLALAGPALARWVPAFVPLLVPALVLASRRRERALAGGALTVTAASLMALVAAHPDPLSLPSAPDAGAAFAAAAGSFAYFFGTVLYVKTNIRERGSRGYLGASVAWHAAVTLAAAALASVGVLAWWWAPFFAAATARAWLVPRRGRPLSPKHIGFIEIGFCLVLVACFASW